MWVSASSWKCPFISESAHILLWVSCQLISLSPLISTKCSNYTRISWATKTQKMASYLPPPRLTLALKLDRLPQMTGRRERKGWGGQNEQWEIFEQHKDRTRIRLHRRFLIGLSLLRGAPNLEGLSLRASFLFYACEFALIVHECNFCTCVKRRSDRAASGNCRVIYAALVFCRGGSSPNGLCSASRGKTVRGNFSKKKKKKKP